MSTGTVKVRYTNGEGNNIFQYMYARLLAHVHGLNLSASAVPSLGNVSEHHKFNKDLPIVKIGYRESDFQQYIFENYSNVNFYVHSYPEDYKVYEPYLDVIKTWVPTVDTSHPDDLVFHLRLGDRLLRLSDYSPSMKTSVEEYVDTIKSFDYDNLYIVTDMKKWGYITQNEVSCMRFHVGVASHEMVSPNIAANYYNTLVDGLSKLNPIVRVGYTVADDFNFMRTFGKVLFKHGTLAWWASVLSNAEKVGVYGAWRPIKGDRNKNLGQTNYKGWFQWGSVNE